MACADQKVITFLSQYGALCFRRKHPECTLKPVPRALSSSCGTAAFLEGEVDVTSFDNNTEAVYAASREGWRLIWKRGD